MTRLSLRCVVLACLLVGGVMVPFAAPAAAQTATNTSSNPATTTTATTNASTVGGNRSSGGAATTADLSSLRSSQGRRAATNGSRNTTGSVRSQSAANNSSNGGGNRGLIDKAAGGVASTAEGAWNSATPDVPSTSDIANGTANWTEQHLLNATTGILDTSIGFVVGTSHPVNSGAAGIFGTPTNAPYKGLYKSVYGPFSFQYSVLILLILLFALVIVMPYAGLASGGTYRATQACARIVAALFLIMWWWPIGTALSTFFDAIATGIAPSGTELTHSMNGLFKLSLGPILAGIALYAVDFGEILGLAFVYAFRQAALILFQFAMPLILIFAYAGPHRRVRSMASTIAWQYFSLLTMTIPTAFIMRIAFEADWNFGLGALGNAIISIMLLAIALVTPFIFSIAAFRAPPSIQGLASSAAGAAAGAGASAKKRAVGSDEEDEEYENEDETEDPAPSGSVYNTVVMMGPDERVAATDGGTNYTDSSATARGPGPTNGALPGGTGGTSGGGTAERIRNFGRQSNEQSGGSAAEKTRYFNNQNDVIDVDGTVVNEEDSS